MSDTPQNVKSSQLIEDKSSIQFLYNKIMKGFEENRITSNLGVDENVNDHVLYAPGYEDMGVGDIVAQFR